MIESETFFKRIYGDIEGQQKFVFENNNQKYLTHSLIQSILYNMDQTCSITFENNKRCLNDGFNVTAMTLDDFYDFVMPRRFYDRDKNGRRNSITRAPIAQETFHFYDCVTGTNTFNKDDFDAYKRQYDRAQLMLMSLSPLDGISDEVKGFVESNILSNKIRGTTSAEEIKKLLEKATEDNTNDDDKIMKMKKGIKALLNSEDFKKEYNKARLGYFEQFKNFVLKCIARIVCFVEFFSKGERITDMKRNINKKDREIDNNEKVQGFRSFVLESDALKKPAIEVS